MLLDFLSPLKCTHGFAEKGPCWTFKKMLPSSAFMFSVLLDGSSTASAQHVLFLAQ